MESTIIEPRRGLAFVPFHDLWRHRELLAILVWRDLTVRYKQTVAGIGWAVIQPLATMFAFSLFFGRVAGNSSNGVPYTVFAFAGLLPWYLFANTVNSAANSITGNQALITKVFFPRIILPIGSAGPYIVDFMIAFSILLLMMLWYGIRPGWSMLLVPLLLLGVVSIAVAIGTILAALTVIYRDIRIITPFLVQTAMFLTPSIYMPNAPTSSDWASTMARINPINGLIANFRSAMLGGPIEITTIATSLVIGLSIFLVGWVYFHHVDRSFADVI